MLRILHFADAHIDMAGMGRHDPATGLPVRVLDFLKSLDTIVDTAIAEKVDLVLFAGDAYKDRTPTPTFQREWGQRIMRLSQAGIFTLMLTGNHDVSPAAGRAHTLQEFETLRVPHVRVASRPSFLTPADLGGIPLQVLALPWVTRSGIIAALEMSSAQVEKVNSALEERLVELVRRWLDEVDPHLPVILASHASVQGAKYGAERSVMLGGDLVLSGSLVCDPRLDYVALGHIHKAQNVNEGGNPPVVYPGSIERVDFGEAGDDKYFVIAHIEKGTPTRVEWRKLEGRRFIERFVEIKSADQFHEQIINVLPTAAEMSGAMLRLTVRYPRQLETLLDVQSLQKLTEPALEFRLVRQPQMEARLRLPADRAITSLTPQDLLKMYLDIYKSPPEESSAIQKLAEEILRGGNDQGEAG